MTKIIGITGGIGSGKSMVSSVFERLGTPVYNSDQRAKDLYIENEQVKNDVMALLGRESYSTDGSLNRAYIAQTVFSNQDLLEQLNAIIHPAVRDDFNAWVNNHLDRRYVIKEAAILIETGGHESCDQVILVTCDTASRIDRVQQRDGTSREEVLQRMSSQWTDEQKEKYADYIINNENDESILHSILSIHQELTD